MCVHLGKPVWTSIRVCPLIFFLRETERSSDEIMYWTAAHLPWECHAVSSTTQKFPSSQILEL